MDFVLIRIFIIFLFVINLSNTNLNVLILYVYYTRSVAICFHKSLKPTMLFGAPWCYLPLNHQPDSWDTLPYSYSAAQTCKHPKSTTYERQKSHTLKIMWLFVPRPIIHNSQTHTHTNTTLCAGCITVPCERFLGDVRQSTHPFCGPFSRFLSQLNLCISILGI